MRKSKIKQRKRGFIPMISVIMMMAIGTFSLVIGMIMPFILLRIHIVRHIAFMYNYENAYQTLETSMSLTREMQDIYGNNEYRRASKIVGEYITTGRTSTDIDFLQAELYEMSLQFEITPDEALTPFKCYKLFYDPDDKVLAEKICTYWVDLDHEATKYNATIYITTPAGVSAVEIAIE